MLQPRSISALAILAYTLALSIPCSALTAPDNGSAHDHAMSGHGAEAAESAVTLHALVARCPCGCDASGSEAVSVAGKLATHLLAGISADRDGAPQHPIAEVALGVPPSPSQADEPIPI